LFIRGIDDDGRVANFVETEQILQLDEIACSYVQVNIKLAIIELIPSRDFLFS
jgi:hypothetical protein